jgi:carboxypeptidase family protein
MKLGGLLGVMVLVPRIVLAQPAIAGAVHDVTGAARADVTVEAASPALIEKTRSTTTDASGRYRIENLPPGVYSVRFTMRGFAPFERDGVELSGSLTVTVDAELGVEAVAETTAVVGSVPLVDVYTATPELTLGGTVIKSLPTSRSYNSVLFAVPGVVTTPIDPITGTSLTSFPVHGGRNNEGRLTVDGWTVGSPPSGNTPTNYSIDLGNSVEVSMSAAGLGERETGGVLMNVVTRSGGNARSGSLYMAGTARALQSNNVTTELQALGATAMTPLSRVYDVSATYGGPLKRDRAWYSLAAHSGGSRREVPNVYYNANAGDPSKWLYAPDLSHHEYSDRTFENASGRLTWQATPRNKITGYWDAQAVCRQCTGATPGAAEPLRITPEAVGVLGRRLDVTQAAWTSPVSAHVLLEAGYGGTYFGVGNFERDPNPTRDLIRVAEQCASGCAANGGVPGLVYRSQDYSVAHTGSYLWKGSAAYVSGTTSVKAGYQHALMTDDRTWYTSSQNLTYRLNNGIPNQLTESISPWVNNARAGWDAVYAQVQRTEDRLTVQGAIRLDRATSWFPAQQEGPSRFLPSAIAFPETTGVNSYKDLSPRLGAVYDPFGDGRTAIKLNIGKYLEGVGVTGTYANTNPTLRLPQTTSVFGTAGVTRTWIDGNANFVPDCDLLNPAAQDFRAGGGDMCGVMSNTSFGTNVLTNNFDPRLLDGWGVRPSDWTFGLSLQQRLGRRAAVSVTYTRRSFSGFSVADNRAVVAADFTPFTLIAPADPRLPGGGGYVIDGLYDVVPGKAGQVDNLITEAGNYGKWLQYFNGLDAGIDVRSQSITVSAGVSAGQTVTDNCDVRAHLPELSTATTGTSTFGAGLLNSTVTPVSPYCHAATGVLTHGRALASYLVPRLDVQLSAVFQSHPGAMLAANYAAPNSAVAPSLGRDLSGNAPNVTINLIAPGSLYGDRVNELDLRVGKRLNIARTRWLVSADVYNTLNSSAVLAYNSTFVPGGTWLQPLTIQTPRFIRLVAEIQF